MKKLLFFIVILFSTLPLFAFQPVKGTVSSSAGGVLIGATVLIKGTASGTTTDSDGKYSIECPPNAKLVFSYTGFDSQEVNVGGRLRIDVTLQESTGSMSESPFETAYIRDWHHK